MTLSPPASTSPPAAAAGGGTDALTAAMDKEGLTASDQAQLKSDEKLGHLSAQLQEEMKRKIRQHAGSAGGMSPAVSGWLKELDQELVKQQQQMQPEPAPAFIPAVAARSAAAAGGGSDAFTAAMEKEGLTKADQAKLVQGGVNTLQLFSMLTDDDFVTSGIDIAARRCGRRWHGCADRCDG